MKRDGFFKDHFPQGGEVYNLWILVIPGYTNQLAFGRTFSRQEAENRKRVVLKEPEPNSSNSSV